MRRIAMRMRPDEDVGAEAEHSLVPGEVRRRDVVVLVVVLVVVFVHADKLTCKRGCGLGERNILFCGKR
jgi:hypothetical protein